MTDVLSDFVHKNEKQLRKLPGETQRILTFEVNLW